MYLSRKKKRVIPFLILLIVITVGYAFLSETLVINGTANIKKTTWSIIWDNVQVKDGSVKDDAVTTDASITNTEKTLVEYSINLSEPGEFYEFTVDAKNEGTIDGMVNVVTNKAYQSDGITERELPEYLTYTVTYSDGTAIESRHLLSAGSTEKYKVRVEYKKDIEASELPTESETLIFKFSVDYIQADDSSQEVVHKLTGTRYTTNKIINDNDNSYVLIGQKTTDNIILYNSGTEAKANFNNRPFYLKHEIENDIVKDSYVCFEKDGSEYCIRGQYTSEKTNNLWQCKSEFYDVINDQCISTYYESNKTILKEAFGESNCDEYPYNLNCGVDEFYVSADKDGGVSAYDDTAGCSVSINGRSGCQEW